MPEPKTLHAAEVDGHMLSLRSVRVARGELLMSFGVSGPQASPQFVKDHVLLLRPGDSSKLTSRGGEGRIENTGSAFFDWRFDWPGGDGVHVIYFAGSRDIVAREWVSLSN